MTEFGVALLLEGPTEPTTVSSSSDAVMEGRTSTSASAPSIMWSTTCEARGAAKRVGEEGRGAAEAEVRWRRLMRGGGGWG